jgi:release factor glutamine methyltransferase
MAPSIGITSFDAYCRRSDLLMEHHFEMGHPPDMASVTRALETAGCVAPGEEAVELIQAAHGDEGALARMLARRITGEPLAWITGSVDFCGLDVAVDPGVYVPRWQSEPLAMLAAELLPPTGLGVDLCTGSGAIAMVMQTARPGARVVGTEIDSVAANCARRNGVVVYEGDLDDALPAELASQIDVMVGVLPYVPSDAIQYLPRDVQHFEPRMALDGGEAGLALISTIVPRSPRWIRPGGWLALEIGSDQVAEVATMLTGSGYVDLDVLADEEGDPRGIYGRLGA